VVADAGRRDVFVDEMLKLVVGRHLVPLAAFLVGSHQVILNLFGGAEQQISNRRRVPGATACRADATGIECRGDGGERRDAGGLDLTDDRQDIAGELICGRPVCRVRLDGSFGGARVAELRPGRFLRCERRPGASGNQRPLFFGERGIQVQHERVGVGAELGHDERHVVAHQAADEMNVAAQPIELGDDDWASRLPGLPERCGQLGPTIEGVGALAVPFCLTERGNGRSAPSP
jgi:hypothetical protein